MPTFVLIPGAGGVAWYWHRVVPLLEAANHEAIAVDLPGDDERAGLTAYADRVVEAIGAREKWSWSPNPWAVSPRRSSASALA